MNVHTYTEHKHTVFFQNLAPHEASCANAHAVENSRKSLTYYAHALAHDAS